MAGRIEVVNKIRVYELNGREIGLSGRTVEEIEKSQMIVKSHRIRDEFVILSIDGEDYTVVASDLKAASDNAQNSGR